MTPKAVKIFGGVMALLAAIVITPLGNVILDRFAFFYGQNSEETARGAISEASLRIASDHFPIGSGAGTFASGPSVQEGYSDVYYLYDLANVWGASPSHPHFIQDAAWPKILGEYGWLGLVSYILILFCMIWPVIKALNSQVGHYAFGASSIACLSLFVSVGSAPFTDEFLGFLLALYAGYVRAKSMVGRDT